MEDLEAELRKHALAEWPTFDWGNAEVRVGAFHTVAIPPSGPILRVTTGNEFLARAEREAQILRTVA